MSDTVKREVCSVGSEFVGIDHDRKIRCAGCAGGTLCRMSRSPLITTMASELGLSNKACPLRDPFIILCSVCRTPCLGNVMFRIVSIGQIFVTVARSFPSPLSMLKPRKLQIPLPEIFFHRRLPHRLHGYSTIENCRIHEIPSRG